MNRQPYEHAVSRRAFLKGTAGLASAAGVGVLLGACGSSSGSPTTSTSGSTGGQPKRGGTFKAGFTGGSSSDTVDGFNIYTWPDDARTTAIFEQLVQFQSSGEVALRMAEEFEPNSDGTVWTIRVRPGVTFHNGKPLTADDVIFTFQYMLNPKTPTLGSAAMTAVDPHGLKKLDNRTVQVQMTEPQFSFREQMSTPYFPIAPVGYDPKHPIGTGAFVLKSFTPGQESVMTRFDDYYLSPMPYFDELVIQDFPASTSQVDALIGGQINGAASIPAVSARELASQSSVKVINVRSAPYNEYPMRTDIAPFADVRVRQAMRLLVDRQQIVTNVFDGQAVVGNDIFAKFDPDYNSSLPQREQDVAQAKHLLKAAGMSDYAFTLVSGPWTVGLLEGAETIGAQATAAGVKLTVVNQPVAEFVAQGYLKDTFASNYWDASRYAAQCILSMTPTSAQNDTHWNDPEWGALWKKLNRTGNATDYRDVVHQMQAIEWERGGMIIPAFYNQIDGVSSNVQGFDVPNTVAPFGGLHFERAWFS